MEKEVKKEVKKEVMSKKEQIRNLHKICETYKVPFDFDLIDFSALVDEKLQYEENKNLLMPLIEGLSVKTEQTHKEKIETDLKQKGNSVKAEKEKIAKAELEGLKEEAKVSEQDFEKAINSIKFESSKELESYFNVTNKLLGTLVNSKKIEGMILQGGAGLGKSFNTIKKLADLGLKKGKDYEILSSYVTPLELYKFLYDNRNGKIIILDDTMGFFNNKINIGIVLSALWGEGKRIIHYHSSSGKLEVPQSFIFESKIVWCVNELPKNMESVKSRCFYHELEFSYGEKIKLMYEIAKIQDIPFEIVDFIKESSDESTENMDFRLLWKVNEIFKANPKEWKEIAIVGLCKDEKLVLLKQLLKECDTSIAEVEKKWCEKTQMCRKSFYNYKQRIESVKV
jgi:DNA polymerase III delta prime subunit